MNLNFHTLSTVSRGKHAHEWNRFQCMNEKKDPTISATKMTMFTTKKRIQVFGNHWTVRAKKIINKAVLFWLNVKTFNITKKLI